MSNKKLALIFLLVSGVGFIATYPFAGNNFFIGLIHAGFGAAMVGGMADWFAVTALFHPVLCFPHTDIIRSERKELTQAIVDFACKDLLSVENINQRLQATNISNMVVVYLTKFNGRTKIRNLLHTLVLKTLDNLDVRTIVKKLEPDIRQCISDGAIEKAIPKIVRKIIEYRHTVDFYAAMLSFGKAIINQPVCQKIFLENVSELAKNFTEDSFVRRTLRSFSSDLSDEKILEKVMENANSKLDALIRNPHDSFRVISYKVEEFLQSQTFMELMNQKKNDLLANADLFTWLKDTLESYRRENKAEILKQVDRLLDWAVDGICKNPDWQEKLNNFAHEMGAEAVKSNHEKLSGMVRGTLDAKTDDEIVSMAENSAGDDAHAIRISGTLVGAIAGMFLYTISYFVEGALR